MTEKEITVGVKVGCFVTLPGHPAGSIGIVREIANDVPLSGGGGSGCAGLSRDVTAIASPLMRQTSAILIDP